MRPPRHVQLSIGQQLLTRTRWLHVPPTTKQCVMLTSRSWRLCLLSLLGCTIFFAHHANASIGDRLPEFRSCVKDCTEDICAKKAYSIPLHRQLLLWDCPSECDYSCQHIITKQRIERDPPYLEPVYQFHGKWPFYRFMGIQEPASVLFSLLNFLAHEHGINKIKEHIPASYKLRKYYLLFGYFGMASWTFSMIFHTRDFGLTEKLDYFGAGASVMYGMYFAPIRIFRLDKPDSINGRTKGAVMRFWTFLCISLYIIHVSFLTFVRFDYTYNMAANVAVGIIQNALWSGFAIVRFRKVGRLWAAWPGMIVTWIILAMSLELFDFPPWWGMVDAHALWHLGTVGPVVWWYNFLVKDAQEDLQSGRLKD
ncbi:Hypothetical protein R9X50_00226600 [Acrodontium crateriforme]|uniref:Post-GPI attachment to proteins factor 3 n=1 Tax=Acrodontium crateriforme TaxID=150365 RepID=A0AAQ3M3K3_9PEZI|nr:Hypothetical protein R9X50_00226600 [Acrodontium crateriforme]